MQASSRRPRRRSLGWKASAGSPHAVALKQAAAGLLPPRRLATRAGQASRFSDARALPAALPLVDPSSVLKLAA